MKQEKNFVREVMPHVKLYRDEKTGIAWIADGRVGLGLSVHANIHGSGSVRGMKDRGFWGQDDRAVRSHGFIYNIDRFVCDKDNELEMLVAQECMCDGCKERRSLEQEQVESVDELIADATNVSVEAPSPGKHEVDLGLA